MKSKSALFCLLNFACVLGFLSPAHAQPSRLVIADQDSMGPAGSDTRAFMVFLQAPDVHLLGITVVAGDGWRDEEVAHTLRTLELLGRTDVKVYPGAEVPLWRTREWTKQAEAVNGKAHWQGAWRNDNEITWDNMPDLVEGNPTTKPADEDAAHFMVRMVREYPGQVTIYGGGPLTNIATAIRLDPEFPRLAQELVMMGGSIRPETDQPEWANAPRHEFNFWWDPEAASIVLRAPWNRISQTTIDASIETRIYPEIVEEIFKSNNPAALYLKKYLRTPIEGVGQFAWDELTAFTWLDRSIITEEKYIYEDVNTEHGFGYGDTLTWSEELKPKTTLNKVHLHMSSDLERFSDMMIELFSAPTPGATNPLILSSPDDSAE